MQHHRSLRELAADAARAPRIVQHPVEHKGRVFRVDGRMVREQAQELHGGGGFEPVAVLQGVVRVHGRFRVLQVEPGDAHRSHVVFDDPGSPDRAKHDVCRNVIAL